MPEFAFDIRLDAAVRVNADNRDAAGKLLRETLTEADCNGGAWPDGEPVLFEATLNEAPSLYEVDGEPVKEPNLIPYRVQAVWGGQPSEGDFVGYFWAKDRDDAERQCIEHMDSESEYCRGMNVVNGVDDMRELARSLQEFINAGPGRGDG